MEIAKSNIVRSDAGRDKGKLFVVLAVEGVSPAGGRKEQETGIP